MVTGATLWQGTSRFLDGRLAAMTLGSVPVSQTYYSLGLPKTIKANGGALQNAYFEWDASGRNLTSRIDGANGLGTAQNFGYDTLNRLTSVNGFAIAYDDGGSLLSRGNGGLSYAYANDARRRLLSTTLNGVTTSYSDDGVGNVLTSGTKTIAWKPFNMPASVTSPTASLSWTYDGELSRVKEVSSATGTTTYFPGVDRIQAADGTRSRIAINTPEGPVGCWSSCPTARCSGASGCAITCGRDGALRGNAGGGGSPHSRGPSSFSPNWAGERISTPWMRCP